MNEEHNNLYRDTHIVKDIKIMLLEWLGHLWRMYNNRIPKVALVAILEGKRKGERPKLRWLVDIQVDLKMTGIKGWKKARKIRRDGCKWGRIRKTKKSKAQKNIIII
jgi:hypothetical protein